MKIWGLSTHGICHLMIGRKYACNQAVDTSKTIVMKNHRMIDNKCFKCQKIAYGKRGRLKNVKK